MEKYSAYRDPGTGIQPFLTPIPPLGSDRLVKILKPIGYAVGAIRTAIVLVLALLYLVFVQGVCLILAPIPPIRRAVTYVFTAFISRLTLLVVGVWWIPVEHVTRKRRTAEQQEAWAPKPGDLIVSNWVSWIEILWLAFRFDPVFILPVTPQIESSETSSIKPTVSNTTPGRRTGTGSAAISTPSSRPTVTRLPVQGFREVSLLSMLKSTGHIPPFYGASSISGTEGPKAKSLDEIRNGANRPIVVFPECTTSNGRGLLRFTDVFLGQPVPTRKYKVFIMCVRYDPPTALSPTPTHSIPPPNMLDPLPHIFTLSTSFKPITPSIRLLSPSEGPSSPTFLVSEVISGGDADSPDHLSTVCAALLTQVGKLKRMTMGWEDKRGFLELYREKRR